MKMLIFAGLAGILCSSCVLINRGAISPSAADPGPENAAITAPVVVYKTKKDYSRNVPVTLSADRSRIAAYPAPADLKRQRGSYAYPTSLKAGYLLDNRGIGPNTAFLRLSYEEYAALTENPSLEDLKSWILDVDPILEIYRCEQLRRTEELEAELNRIIKNKELASLCTAVAAK